MPYVLANITIPDEDDFESTDMEQVWVNMIASLRTIDAALTTVAGHTSSLSTNTSDHSTINGRFVAKQVLSADGAVTLKEGTCLITKSADAVAGTLAAPTATTDDGKVLRIIATTAKAHVITGSVDGFNAKGSSGTLTFGGAIGDAVTLVAYNGHWYTSSLVNVTVA
jgi:hypothetical protein